MKQVILSYWQFEDVDMQRLDAMLFRVSEPETIQKAIASEPKLKAGVMKARVKGTLQAEFVEQVSYSLADKFNVFNYLGNHFLEKQAKKYEPLAKHFVALAPDAYDAFLQQHVTEQQVYERFVTMIRFLKQNGTYTEPLRYVLQAEPFLTVTAPNAEEEKKGDDIMTNPLQQKMHDMLDELFKQMGDPEQLKMLKEEQTANRKKIKALEKKLATITKEIETAKKQLDEEKEGHKQTKDTLAAYQRTVDEKQREINQYQRSKDKMEQEIKVLRNTIEYQKEAQKKELVQVEQRVEEQYQKVLNKQQQVAAGLDGEIHALKSNVAALNAINSKLRSEVEQLLAEKEKLQAAITELKVQPAAVAAMSTPAQTTNTLQQGQLHLLQAVGFGPDDDDTDLFDLDDNAPSFD